ncbi:hypothetical protein HanXRQr2_Chr09g0404601 [Helianthus annuus]|uniref:Uncharacterized protein n=1 Tax=Helianthus annuus TaxID=4232 RepID=A0A9K3I8T3_HELAN|nr:hypothetical protein HanXRQr2_Chr09g0404601 [Helianthus annuus]KAJ0894571.1 hypothetical protein HanPSC8_Chr09g0390531 [Helianthus annuus]
MLGSDLCHFLCFVLDEYFNGMKKTNDTTELFEDTYSKKNSCHLCHFKRPQKHKHG